MNWSGAFANIKCKSAAFNVIFTPTYYQKVNKDLAWKALIDLFDIPDLIKMMNPLCNNGNMKPSCILTRNTCLQCALHYINKTGIALCSLALLHRKGCSHANPQREKLLLHITRA